MSEDPKITVQLSGNALAGIYGVAKGMRELFEERGETEDAVMMRDVCMAINAALRAHGFTLEHGQWVRRPMRSRR